MWPCFSSLLRSASRGDYTRIEIPARGRSAKGVPRWGSSLPARLDAGLATKPRTTRRTDIADAAIAVLAAEGSRGLTHRAVDRYLEIPEGSTSHYYRTRKALLGAAMTRLLELNLEQ